MKSYFLLITFICSLSVLCLHAQEKLQWHNPLSAGAVEGRIAGESIAGYGRLEKKLEPQVREAVWTLGKNAAGLYIEFKTAAKSIKVRYQVEGALHMPHMPTIGVSGVDLYAFDGQSWNWASGQYAFKDTVSYSFTDIGSHPEFTYRLYLPLYNTVKWLEIGVDEGESLSFVQDAQRPIVVYGTSIAQGACASRPGLAWTNLLGRMLPQPIVNLGFSGNGRLEEPILKLICAANPAIVVLDCLPNLGVSAERSAAQVDSVVQHAVKYIRAIHPKTPILLTAHSSGNNVHILNRKSNMEFEQTTEAGLQAYESLKKQGVADLYYLSNAAIGLDVNMTVDYAHPNDLGMLKIAEAYRDVLKTIIK